MSTTPATNATGATTQTQSGTQAATNKRERWTRTAS